MGGKEVVRWRGVIGRGEGEGWIGVGWVEYLVAKGFGDRQGRVLIWRWTARLSGLAGCLPKIIQNFIYLKRGFCKPWVDKTKYSGDPGFGFEIKAGYLETKYAFRK